MVGVSKFTLLLASPLSLLHHRRTSLLRLTRTISTLSLFPSSHPYTPHQPLFPLIKASSNEFHTQTNHTTVHEDQFGGNFTPSYSHPWPEWLKLIDALSALGYLDFSRGVNVPEDYLVSYDGLPEQFVREVAVVLTFARDRPDILGLLSKSHVEMLVQNGAPFLFKSALDTEKRMRSFLGSCGISNVVEPDKAETVDLLKYIVSSASNPVASGRSNISYPQLPESPVRFLLNKLVDLSCRAKDSDVNYPEHNPITGKYGQTSKFLGPKIEMKRGDWICSKCSFMNFARNLKCLECEGPRPKRLLTGGEWECPQCDFLNYGRNIACLRCDCKRPGEALLGNDNPISASGYNNGGYASNDMMNNDGRSAYSQNQSILGNQAIEGSSPRSRTSSQYRPQRGNNSGYTPFVPLPPDMFAKKNQETTTKDGNEAVMKNPNSISSNIHNQMGTVEEGFQLSGKPSIGAGGNFEQKGQEEKTERWFKRVSELHNVPDLANTVSSDEFPDIMPIRKGENRFVISKNKDRSLSTPAYKRHNPIEQGDNSQFGPFVPFPPGYFAKKDNQQSESRDPTTDFTAASGQSTFNKSDIPPLTNDNRESAIRNPNPNPNLNVNSSANNFGSQSSSSNSWNTSGGPTSSQNSNAEGYPSQPQENQNLRSGWTGKSLEGSAVKETDPLDMSEEAKAERWFRRVAQIKDISELSQIPDEDFPSIMPMRKGVNRFVVSKRKTPLERRLTSPQYRKNLPVMNSEPLKKENDDS